MKKRCGVLVVSLLMGSINAETEMSFLERTKERLKEVKAKTGAAFEDARKSVDKLFGKMSPHDQAEQLLTDIHTDLQKIRTVVVDALEKGSFDQKTLKASLARLEGFIETIAFLEQLDEPTKQELKIQADRVIKTYQALQEESAVLDLWMRGYDAYVKDLDDNFKKLPNDFVKKPDNKKLYQELGFASTADGVRASFNEVRQNYDERFKKLKSEHKSVFNEEFFRPYLRVLDYVFKTPYSKKQYDAFVKGAAVYNGKIASLKKHEAVVQKLFTQDLPGLRMITGVIESSMQ